MDALTLLKKWFEFSKYDPEQKKFVLDDYTYENKRGNDLIVDILENYDSTGMLSVLCAKVLFRNMLANKKPKSFLSLMGNTLEYDNILKMWNIFNSEDMVVVKKIYLKIL